MDSGFSNMLENTRKYFQGIPNDAAAAAAAAQLHFAPPLPPSHHLHHNGGGRTPMSTSSSSSSSSAEPSSAVANDRFAGYHHPHLQRYNYQPYTSPGHYPRTAVDPKPAAFQHHHHFQPPSLQQYHHHQLPPSSSSSPSSPYKSPFQLQPPPPPPPPPTVKQQQPPPLAQSPFKPAAARSSPPAGKQYSPTKPSPYAVVSKPSPYSLVPKPITTAPPPQSPFTAPKEQHAAGLQQPSVPETPPPTPHSSHYYNRTTHSSNQQQQQQQQLAIDRDYLRFKPIQTPPPPPPNRFQPLERPKSEVPAGATGPQTSHLAIRYDPKLEQPRSGVRAVPIAQAKQPSSSATTSHEINRVIVQKPEPRYHQQPQQQQQTPSQQPQQQQHLNHRSSDDHHHHKRPASVQPSYLDSRPFQIKPYDGGSNSSNSSSSNGSSGQSSSYHRPFAVAPPTVPPTSSQSSPAVIVASMDHRWTVFGRQDARTPAFLQQPPSSASAAAAAAAAAINGYHHHRQPPSSSSLPVIVSQHLQHQSSSMSSRQPQQQQQQHYPLNLHKLTPPARPATAAGQLQQVKGGQENTTNASTKLRFEMKRESPLDLSVKTVCRSADSTDDRLNPFGHDIPKVNFKPDFNACRGPSTSLSGAGTTAQPAPPTIAVVVSGQPQHNVIAPTYHQLQAPPLSLPPPPLPITEVSSQQQQQQPPSSSPALQPIPLPPVVHHQGPPLLQLSAADEAWRAAIDRQIEQKFSTYTSAKKHHHHHHHHLQLQHQQQQQHPQLPPVLQPQQQQQGPAQADKRVLEILKQNIEARDQSSRPQIAEAPSTPAMVFSTPIRKEPSTTPLKKTDYYMAERTAVTPFPKKIDYYMDRAYCNAPRIRTKAERKQVSAEGSSSGMRMSSPMAAATAISPHPFLPSNNSAPQTKQEQIPLTQTESVVDAKLDIKREPSPIKDPELCSLNKDDAEKDDDEEFWMNTCNSFVVQLAETQEKKKVKTPVKRKLPKEQLPQPPKRKYTKRIKVEPISESEQDNKIPDFREDVSKKPTEEVKSEKSTLQEKMAYSDKPAKMESLDMDKENKTKQIDQEKLTDDKKKEDDDKETSKMKPKRKRLFKLKFPKPLLVTKVKKIKKEDKKELKMKKEAKKEEKKELRKVEKKETIKKDLLLQKMEKKELAAAAKVEKKGLKKEEKRDLKKDPQNNKKDLNIKKESKKAEATRKKAAEKENVTKVNENTTRRSAAAAAAAAINEVSGKFNPRQSLRRKNSLKDYTFAFDELLDDAFAHFEADEIPMKAAAAALVVKKPKEKDSSESMRMKLRSRSRPLLAKQEPLLAAKKKAIAKNKNIPKRRRKKSLGEKSAHAAVATANDWKDELYKFKRSLRLPSKLISVVSPPSAVGPDQVSLTSIMNIPPLLKPSKIPKATKSTTQSHATAAAAVTVTATAGKNKTKRLGHLFGRRDVFKGRRLLKREKIVSAEKLMQRNLRKRRQQEDEEKKGCAGEEATADLPDNEDVNIEVDEDDDDDDDDNKNGRKPPARMLFKRKFMRKKFRSGFDYIKKKKKKEPASEKKQPASVTTAVTSMPPPKCAPRFVSEIQADIKVWIVNKGHGETVLHRAARLGVKDVVGFCIEKLEYAPSVADNAGYTPLHEACSQGHYHIAKLLLQFGADVSASAQGGIRPLHEAVENGDVHLVRLLLGYGADPRLATYSGQSPLSLASDKQTKMLLEHHVNDIQGYGNASVWNFDETTLNGEPEDVDRLLWCSPPQLSADDGPSFEFEFEFADQSLPDVYKLPSDEDVDAIDDWVLFSDVSAALSVKTADALAKLLDDETAVTAVPLDRFNERAMPRKTLGRQPAVVTATNKTANKDAAAGGAVSATEENASAATGEQILLVRYDRKLKQLLGVDAFSVS